MYIILLSFVVRVGFILKFKIMKKGKERINWEKYIVLVRGNVLIEMKFVFNFFKLLLK